jgi:hypothetical protein
VFDASALRQIPNAQSVSVDCLMDASGLEALSSLRVLAELRLGVFELKDAEVLRHCARPSLKSLVLGDTRKCSVNLSYLSECTQLEELGTAGHTKNIATICKLPSFRHLSLRCVKNKDDIAFVSDIPELHSLDIVLGGRTSIASVVAPRLRRLEIVRVRGLEDVGALGRFTFLENFVIQDQIKLGTLNIGPNPHLKEVKIINCKTLKQINGLSELRALTSLFIARTALDYRELVQQPLPDKLATFAFYSGKSKPDSEIQKDLASRGFREYTAQ